MFILKPNPDSIYALLLMIRFAKLILIYQYSSFIRLPKRGIMLHSPPVTSISAKIRQSVCERRSIRVLRQRDEIWSTVRHCLLPCIWRWACTAHSNHSCRPDRVREESTFRWPICRKLSVPVRRQSPCPRRQIAATFSRSLAHGYTCGNKCCRFTNEICSA